MSECATMLGLCTVELYFPNGHSLKEKRQILHSLKDRLRKLNVSVAEVGGQDLWQKAFLGIACVSNERAHVTSVLDQALNMIREVPTLEVLQSRIELL
ncbi:MAG: DUF503 domain-containing protein [Nitrospiraceae bacterium]